MKHTEHVKRIENRSRLPPAVDYQSYSLSSREMAEHILECALFVMLVSWLFYDSLRGAVCGAHAEKKKGKALRKAEETAGNGV